MSTSVKSSDSLSKDIFLNDNNYKTQIKSSDGNKDNWTKGLVVINELDDSDNDDSSSTSSSFTSEVSHSTTHNSAVLNSDSQNYYSSQTINSQRTSFAKPTTKETSTVFYSASNPHSETNTQKSSSNSSGNSKLSKSTTTSDFSMEQDDQDRDSCRSDDTDSPVGPPTDKKLLPIPQSASAASTMPNYVNVTTTEGNISGIRSDDNDLDDIKSGKVIGANLSDEEEDDVDDSYETNRQNGYNRRGRDNHQSR